MAEIEVTFGETFEDSEFKVAGEVVRRVHKAKLITGEGHATVFEVEVVRSGLNKGRYFEVIRRRITEPVTVKTEIPDVVANQILARGKGE
jgi:hypothetical protein